MFESLRGEKKPKAPQSELEALAEKYGAWLPDQNKIDETIDINSLSDEELKKISIMFLRAANNWTGHDVEYAGGYAALSTAYAMQVLLRRER